VLKYQLILTTSDGELEKNNFENVDRQRDRLSDRMTYSQIYTSIKSINSKDRYKVNDPTICERIRQGHPNNLAGGPRGLYRHRTVARTRSNKPLGRCCCCWLQGRQLVRDEKQRALRVIGVDDINRKLDAEVNSALDPVDQDLSNERSTLDSQLQRNNQLKAIIDATRII